MAVILSDDDLLGAYRWVAEVLRARKFDGQQPPRWLHGLYEHLDAEFKARVSSPRQPRQENGCDGGELESDERIGAAEAAMILGWNKRTVQRRATDLEGEIVSGSWIFRRSTVLEYADERGGQCMTS